MRRNAILWAVVGLPLLAGQARAGDTFPLDGFLTPPVREAFSAAAGDPRLWAIALKDPGGYLAAQGIEVPRDLGVEFLDLGRSGDWLRFSRPGEATDFFCPPQRMWWQECRKVIRVCETAQVCVPPAPGQDCVVVTFEKNCAFVCEQFIWDEEFTLPNRPPFPPLSSLR